MYIPNDHSMQLAIVITFEWHSLMLMLGTFRKTIFNLHTHVNRFIIW